MARRRTSPAIVGAMLIFVGIILMVAFLGDALISLKEPVDIETVTAEQVKDGTKVEGRLDFILDAFASLETSTNNSPAKTSKLYYIYELMDTGHIMAIEGKVANEDTYNQIMDETYSYIMGESETYGATGIDYVGVIRPIEGDLLKFYNEWATDSGYWDGMTDEETDGLLLPFIVEEVDFLMCWIFSMGGLGIIIVGAVILIVVLLKKKKLAAAAALDYSDTSAEQVHVNATAQAQTESTSDSNDSPEIK